MYTHAKRRRDAYTYLHAYTDAYIYTHIYTDTCFAPFNPGTCVSPNPHPSEILKSQFATAFTI